MSYTALYRKFRPADFGDVKGQDAIVTALRNQVKVGRIGHAFLFCGTRGTGKTTLAQILAKAVNCETPVDGSPCGVCPMCRSIAAGTSMNVIEIDAASNNGVDNIREIVEEVRYSPTEGKYKVYIIDEVHMLSTGAFNALLKTLEEPPPYVIFILATTEVHKIPITILSRCQRYDFHRITVEEIAARLTEIVTTEGIEAEPKALRYIAMAGDGSLRDAISLLDQCIAFYLGETLTYDKVLEVLGTVDVSVFGRLMADIRTGDVARALEILEEIVVKGRELTQFTVDFTWYLRNLLLAKTSDSLMDTLEIPSDYMQEFLTEVKANDAETLVRYIRIFSDLTNKIRYASQKRVLVEVAVIRLCRPQMETDYGSLVQRVGQIEQDVAAQGEFLMHAGEGFPGGQSLQGQSFQGQPFPGQSFPGQSFSGQGGSAQGGFPLNGQNQNGFNQNGQIQNGQIQNGQIQNGQIQHEFSQPPLTKALPEEIAEVAGSWKRIVARLPASLRIPVGNARPSVGGDNELLLVFDDSFDREFVAQADHLTEIKNVIGSEIGRDVEVGTVLAPPREKNSLYPDITQIIKNVPIDFVD